jgi:hypothetical protein
VKGSWGKTVYDMKRGKHPTEPGSSSSKSKAEKLKEQIVKRTGVFRHPDFQPIDTEGRILEKTFYETGETVQVHLDRKGKIQAVYLLRRG